MDGHNCSHMCVELEGSYNCSCYSGYELQEDGVTCEGNCIVWTKHWWMNCLNVSYCWVCIKFVACTYVTILRQCWDL